MVQCGRRLGFPDKSLFGLGVVGPLERKELEGDGALELVVNGLVDNAHPSSTELFADLVAAADNNTAGQSL